MADESPQHRLDTVIALGDMGAAAKPAVDALTQAAEEDPSGAVREAAADALARISGGN
jgi:HEAT repeat protein